jgi:hypothetical protein
MSKDVTELRTADVTADIIVALDGHTVSNYFSDGSAVTYEVAPPGDRPDRIELIAEDVHGGQRRFRISVLDEGMV